MIKEEEGDDGLDRNQSHFIGPCPGMKFHPVNNVLGFILSGIHVEDEKQSKTEQYSDSLRRGWWG